MAIVVRCECGKELRTSDENAGRRGRCTTCGRELIVPQPKRSPDSEFAVLEEPEVAFERTSGKAIASLVLGLCSFVARITGIPALLFGILGLLDINNPKRHLTGKGMPFPGPNRMTSRSNHPSQPSEWGASILAGSTP